VLALGAALVGGTSLMGRRGGIFGTVLASTLLLGLMWLAEGRGWGFNPSWIALGAIVAGFLITRLVEVMNTADDNEAASTRRAGTIADLREDDPPPAERGRTDAASVNEFGEYDEDFAGLGSGDPWTNTGGIRTTGAIPKQGAVADPFGASGVFDDLRDTPRDGSPRHGR
jgi:hypothetical protein